MNVPQDLGGGGGVLNTDDTLHGLWFSVKTG